MIEILKFNKKNKPDAAKKQAIIDFLFSELQEYGDPKDQISAAIDFSLEEYQSFGGFVLVAEENNSILGAVVVNQTGMKAYIPENILVYIATHREQRGKGIGKKLMQSAIENAEGNIALHVEPENPAKFLYEKLGFTNKYLEMRLSK